MGWGAHRAFCRTKLFPLTHVLVDSWMLTVKLVYKLSNVPDDLKWTTNTHVTPFTLTFKAQLTISMLLEDPFLLLHFLPVHPYFYPSIFVFTRPNDGWMGLYIKLWVLTSRVSQTSAPSAYSTSSIMFPRPGANLSFFTAPR